VEATKTVYIRLLEGPETWVPVSAILHGDNIFEIKENQYLDLEEDISSIWEFFPGDVVKCIKRDGDLIATELVESTFSDRKVYQLIFLIVYNLGEITREQLKGFEDEIKRLCSDSRIVQRQHPVVKDWLEKHCK
jgi:hypothetical protein